jgi:death-on-curing family protein
MQEIYCNGKDRIVTLTTDEIEELHKILCDNYELLPEMEPVSPPGIKNRDMLESAVSRQLVGSGDYYKYPDIYTNCATLVFGLVKNHSFHNGNKRIGFLALIKHLYSNGYVIRPYIQHKEIYELLRTLADSALEEHAAIFNKHFYKQHKKIKWTDEVQIKYLALWLRQNAEHKNTKIKQKTIPVNELERLLRTKNLETSFSGKFLTVSKKNSFFQDLLGKNAYKKDYIIKDERNVPLNLIEQMRRDFSIAFLDGVDNSTFYNDEDVINHEIVSYKKIIYKLAKT